MKKTVLLSILCLSFSFVLLGQGSEKLNMKLIQLMSDGQSGQKQINLLVKGNIDFISNLTQQSGGTFRYSYGDIASIKIPVATVAAFAASPQVLQIEMPGTGMVAMNDSMRSVAHVNEVHAGLSPLLQGFDGSGVVIGIIDTGVDLTHPDLQDSAGHTRVKHLQTSWKVKENRNICFLQTLPYTQNR